MAAEAASVVDEQHAASMEGLRQARDVGMRAFVRGYLRERGAVIGLLLLSAISLTAILAPFIAPYHPFQLHATLQPPSEDFIFGTDYLGRDIFSQMVWGGRVSMEFAFGAAGISLVLGVFLGAISGYFGGAVDAVMSRLFEIFLMIPRLFLIILVVALLGTNIWFVVVVIGLTLWPSNARIMRSQVLTLKKRGYVQAAVAAGVTPFTIMMKHVIPNGLAPVIANSTLQMAYAVLTEAGLSFLGLGDPGQVSWGQILNNGQNYMRSAPWIVIVPGLGIAFLLLGLHLVGDGVTRVLNPRLRVGSE